ncbi:uncharacterized protein LOC119568808, partial [Penaeus monodon]|uniref:uncharacterized protein LOC119568808 n=1 Tax=Penaeus monodon TaxID=6687 RepID=UPI0018A7312D
FASDSCSRCFCSTTRIRLGAPSDGGLSAGADFWQEEQALLILVAVRVPDVEMEKYYIIPPPAVEHNILFVRLPEKDQHLNNRSSSTKTKQHCLCTQQTGSTSQRVIEVPAQPQADPEIYFVNYQEGEKPNSSIGQQAVKSRGLEGASGVAGLGGVAGGVGGIGFGIVNGGELGGVNGAGIGLGFNGGASGVIQAKEAHHQACYNTP